MQAEPDDGTSRHLPGYWATLAGGLALLLLGWVGERLDWSATITTILFLLAAACFAVSSLVFGPGRDIGRRRNR